MDSIELRGAPTVRAARSKAYAVRVNRGPPAYDRSSEPS
jgi:hypothetical protein